MKTLTFTAAIMLASLSTFAQNWAMDKAHSKLGFTVTHLMVSDVDGAFKNFSLTINTSKDNFAGSAVELTAEINSINTDNDYRDKDLKSEKFFDAAKFPTLSFKSTSFTKVDDKNYKLSGNLTMHGITKPVVLNVAFNGIIIHPMTKKPVAGFKITGAIKRKDFDIASGFPATVVSDEIQISANVELNKG